MNSKGKNKTTTEGEVKKNKPKKKVKKVITKKPAVNYKKENKKLLEKVQLLEDKVQSLTIQNQIDIFSFQEKAKGFQKKAQVEINKVKDELEKKATDDQAKFKLFANQKVFESIIGPLNQIDIAIKAGKAQGDDVTAYVMGFEMLMNQLFDELESFGLKKIEPKIGEEFSSELHQAIALEKGKRNKILKVNKNGFKLNDRIISPAVVVIGK